MTVRSIGTAGLATPPQSKEPSITTDRQSSYPPVTRPLEYGSISSVPGLKVLPGACGPSTRIEYRVPGRSRGVVAVHTPPPTGCERDRVVIQSRSVSSKITRSIALARADHTRRVPAVRSERDAEVVELGTRADRASGRAR